MQSDDPPFLVVGTEVSAKFKGAFCESKVKKIVKSVKCKVLLKEAPFGSVTVEDTNIRGKLELNQLVEIIQGKNVHKGIIQYIKDCSTYTVVFNDGDERVLRRTQVCLKGGKHFDSAVNLDTMPLYHPDSFANSISRDNKKKVLKRKAPLSSDDEDDEPGAGSFSTNSPSSSRRSIRRSSSVTPLKGIASTRSATRAIAALKYIDSITPQSKSPTPARAILQPRASSVMVSTRRIAASNCDSRNSADGSIKSNSMSEASDNESDNEYNEKLIRKKISKNSLKDLDLKANSDNLRLSSSSGGTDTNKGGSIGTLTDELGKLKKKNFTSQSSSTTSALSTSNVAKLTSTPISSRTATSMLAKEKSENGNTSAVASSNNSSGLKEAKKEKKHKDENAENSSAENNGDKSIDKRFPIGSVVVINEFVPPKIGGRIQLGLVVSVKEYKVHVLNNKIQQLPNLGNRQIPVRIFQSGRYHVADLDHLSTFNPVEFRKMVDTSTSCLKIAFERANLYYTKNELPQSWEKKQTVNSASSSESNKKEKDKKEKDRDKEKEKEKDRKRKEKEKQKMTSKKTESSSGEESSESEEDDDYNERRDRFVAHFYKFQDESGNPMNRVPVLGGKEIDLYRFYDFVNRLGGHKRVTLEGRWRHVLTKLRLEDCSGATPHTVKNAYLRYFEKFEAFMKHLGYSSLNGASSSTTSSRSSRTIRAAYDQDWKKNSEKRKDKRTQDKSEGSTSRKEHRSSSKDSVDTPLTKTPRTTTVNTTTTPTITQKASASSSSSAQPDLIVSSTPRASVVNIKVEPISKVKEEPTTSTSTIVSDLLGSLQNSKSSSSNASDPNNLQVAKLAVDEQPKSTKKHSTLSLSDVKPSKIKREDHESLKSKPSAKGNDSVSSFIPSKIKDKRTKALKKRESQESDMTITSSDEEMVKRLQKQQRRNSIGKEDRVKSPLGHHAVEEQDFGYSNANIFTRFYQGQKVHARHHLRFYDARIVIVKQPSLAEIAKSLVNAFELSKITHTSCSDLNLINLRNMGNELKDALKNMVNATKCFVHYLGWNSRYDEWLMLYKIRVDEKDDKASIKALEALIPQDLPPQLFAVAMDWCESPEGIASLANNNTHANDQQRLRRLSSATTGGNGSGRGKSSSTSSNETASSSSASAANLHGSITSNANTGHYFQSKYATHHYSAGLKASTSMPGSNANAGTSSLASASFSYQSPLSGTKSPATSNSSINFLSIATGNSQEHPASFGQHYNGHSPRSPLQYNLHRSPNFQQHNNTRHSFDETTTKNSLGGLIKFTIPHLQHGQKSLQQLSRTSSVDSVSNIVASSSATPNPIEHNPALAGGAATLVIPMSLTSTQSVTATSSHSQIGISGANVLPSASYQQLYQQQQGITASLLPNSNLFSLASDVSAGILTQSYSNVGVQSIPPTLTSISNFSENLLQTSSPPNASFQSQIFNLPKTSLSSDAISSILLPPPLPPTSMPISSSSIPLQFGGLSPSTVVPYSVVISVSSTQQQLQNTVPVILNASCAALTSLAVSTTSHSNFSSTNNGDACIDVALSIRNPNESIGEVGIILPCHSSLRHVLTIKEDGKCIEGHEVQIVEQLESKITTVIQISTDVSAIRSENADVVDSMFLTVRTSPLTTVSSCGAVEDFDDNSSIRLTETPLNDDDECASIASNDPKSANFPSKSVLSSPSRQHSLVARQRVGAHTQQRCSVIQSIKGLNRPHSKSPCGSSASGSMSSQVPTSLTSGTEAKASTLRNLRRRASKSPDTSAAEDNYEEQTTHTDSSHAVRMRVMQRMDAEHLFASYSFLGLSELETLLSKSKNGEESIKIMEDRMQLLRDIYQTYRGKLTRLERCHKSAMTKKKLQAKENRDAQKAIDGGCAKDVDRTEENNKSKDFEATKSENLAAT